MAELHVQTKKSNTPNSMWIWIVLALVVAGAVIYYLVSRNKAGTKTAAPANTTGAIEPSTNPLRIENILQQQNTAMYFC